MAIPDCGSAVTNTINVSGLSSAINCTTFGLETVCIRINHTWDSDLDIFLIAPDNTRIELTTDNGGSGNNYGNGGTNTCFNMSGASGNVTGGTAPFSGTYIPEGNLGTANNGQNPNGAWRLEITDDACGDVGTLIRWNLTFGASPAPCPPPPGREDCNGGTTVCSSAPFTGNSSGFGTQELNAGNSGCLSIEHQSSWYFFEATNAGTFAFTISPSNGTDYDDFAVWGPYPSGSTSSTICPPSGTPLRCSYAAGGGNTGLLATETDNTEGVGGNRFVDTINANTGDVFILVIDNYSATASPFNLNWSLTNGASLNCNPLKVNLVSFEGYKENAKNFLKWITASEVNNKKFELEKSYDGYHFEKVYDENGLGTSSTGKEYKYQERFEEKLDAYFRLKQIDFNGEVEYHNTIFIPSDNVKKPSIYPNPIRVSIEHIDKVFNEINIYIYNIFKK